MNFQSLTKAQQLLAEAQGRATPTSQSGQSPSASLDKAVGSVKRVSQTTDPALCTQLIADETIPSSTEEQEKAILSIQRAMESADASLASAQSLSAQASASARQSQAQGIGKEQETALASAQDSLTQARSSAANIQTDQEQTVGDTQTQIANASAQANSAIASAEAAIQNAEQSAEQYIDTLQGTASNLIGAASAAPSGFFSEISGTLSSMQGELGNVAGGAAQSTALQALQDKGGSLQAVAAGAIGGVIAAALGNIPGIPQLVSAPSPPVPTMPSLPLNLTPPRVNIASAVQKVEVPSRLSEATLPRPASVELQEEEARLLQEEPISLRQIEECQSDREALTQSLVQVRGLLQSLITKQFQPATIQQGSFADTRAYQTLITIINGSINDSNPPARGARDYLAEGTPPPTSSSPFSALVSQGTTEVRAIARKRQIGLNALNEAVDIALFQLRSGATCSQLDQYREASEQAQQVLEPLQQLDQELTTYIDPSDGAAVATSVGDFLTNWTRLNTLWFSFPEAVQRAAAQRAGYTSGLLSQQRDVL